MKQGNAFGFFKAAGLIVAAIVLWTSQSFAQVIPGEYLVKYKSSAFVSMMDFRATASVRVMDQNPYGHIVKVAVDPAHETQALARLMKNPNVEYVVPNILLHSYVLPGQPTTVSSAALADQWAIKKVNAEAAWSRASNRGSKKVLIAVIDTGADYNHESLKANMVPGYDFINNNNDPMDKTGQNPGHGTHCSGIIGATGTVDGGTIGINPDASIMPIRFLDENGQGDLNNGVKAIDYAIQQHVQVISASWGASISRSQAQPIVDAVKRADDAGVIFVAAAANDGADNDTTEVYPANSGFPNTITVAATGPNDEKPNWSNYGTRTVHLASPGLDILSTLPGNKYGNLSGTSMATPLVAGLVAFLKAQDPALTGAQARALLQTTGAKVQVETACHCRVDALAAVDELISKKMFVTPAAATIAVGDKLQFEGTRGTAPFTYAVSNSSAGSIDAQGVFTASANGDTTVTVTDSAGQTATSLTITVGDKSGGGGGGGPVPDPGGGGGSPIPDPGGGGGGGGMPGTCPIGDKSQCDAICKMQPDLPFCHKDLL